MGTTGTTGAQGAQGATGTLGETGPPGAATELGVGNPDVAHSRLLVDDIVRSLVAGPRISLDNFDSHVAITAADQSVDWNSDVEFNAALSVTGVTTCSLHDTTFLRAMGAGGVYLTTPTGAICPRALTRGDSRIPTNPPCALAPNPPWRAT